MFFTSQDEGKEVEKAIQDQIDKVQKSLLGPGQGFDLKNIFK